MNELLGWYGYEKAADGSIDRKLLKRGGTTVLEKPRSIHVTPKTKYDLDCSNESNDSCGRYIFESRLFVFFPFFY